MKLQRVIVLVSLALPFTALSQPTSCTADCAWDPTATAAGITVSATTVTTWPGAVAIAWSFNVNARYRNFAVVGGRIYEWSMCDADGGIASNVKVMFLDAATNTPLCHWRYISSCGTATIRYQPSANSQVRIYVNDPDCDNLLEGGKIVWRCVSCGDNGCTDAPNGEAPGGAFTPSCTGSPEVITTNAPNGTYTSLQLTAGTVYTLSSMTHGVFYPNPSWITITDATGTTIYGHSQNARNFTPPTTGVYRFYTHLNQVDFGCGTFAGDTRAIRCGTYDPCITTPLAACETSQRIYMQGAGSWPSGPCGNAAGIERVFTYTPVESGVHRLRITNAIASSDGIRYAWKPASIGCGPNDWNCLGTVITSTGQFDFTLTAGVPILILADAVSTVGVWQDVSITCALPPNQTCASSLIISSYPATINVQARWSEGSHTFSCYGSSTYQTVWYKAIGVCGTMTASTCGSDRNTFLAVYSGSCGSLTEVACNDNATTGPCSGTQQSQVSWTGQHGADYYVVVAHQPANAPSNVVLNITTMVSDADNDGVGDQCELRPNVRVMLEGPYDGSTGLMGDGIRNLGMLQLIEPYTNMNYPHVNGGGEATTLSVVSVGGPDAIVDWVVLELRSATTPTLVVDTRSALLQRDGDIVDVDGMSPVNMRSVSGNYHVAVRHRNHLGVMTSAPVALTSASALLDFSSAATSAYGTNARKTSGGTYSKELLWAGDVDFNGSLVYVGANNDRDPILQFIGGSIPTNTSSAYAFSDVNMDGMVRYVGANNDRDPILSNIGGSVPTNTRMQRLP